MKASELFMQTEPFQFIHTGGALPREYGAVLPFVADVMIGASSKMTLYPKFPDTGKIAMLVPPGDADLLVLRISVVDVGVILNAIGWQVVNTGGDMRVVHTNGNFRFMSGAPANSRNRYSILTMYDPYLVGDDHTQAFAYVFCADDIDTSLVERSSVSVKLDGLELVKIPICSPQHGHVFWPSVNGTSDGYTSTVWFQHPVLVTPERALTFVNNFPHPTTTSFSESNYPGVSLDYAPIIVRVWGVMALRSSGYYDWNAAFRMADLKGDGSYLFAPRAILPSGDWESFVFTVPTKFPDGNDYLQSSVGVIREPEGSFIAPDDLLITAISGNATSVSFSARAFLNLQGKPLWPAFETLYNIYHDLVDPPSFWSNNLTAWGGRWGHQLTGNYRDFTVGHAVAEFGGYWSLAYAVGSAQHTRIDPVFVLPVPVLVRRFEEVRIRAVPAWSQFDEAANRWTFLADTVLVWGFRRV